MKKYLCEVVVNIINTTTTTRSDIAVLVAMICDKVVVVDLTMRIHLLLSFSIVIVIVIIVIITIIIIIIIMIISVETFHSIHEHATTCRHNNWMISGCQNV